MNIYQKIYLEDIITQENIKSLIPVIQSDLFQDFGISNYQELSQPNKLHFQERLNSVLQDIKQKVNTLTKNLQYQSWVYKILKNQDKEINQDYNVIKSALVDFQKLCKRPDLTPQQRNINNYATFQDLQAFILSFQKQHKLDTNIYQNLEELYSNEKYTCYLITNYDQCNKLFGGNDYFNTGWCVAKSDYYFNNYLEDYYNDYTHQHGGYIVFIENQNNKPYALLHYDSQQFKDTSDATIKNHDPAIINCLYHLEKNYKAYNQSDSDYSDLKEYEFDIYKMQYPNATYLKFKMDLLQFDFNQQTKTIDCKNNVLEIGQDLLDENIFSYNIINCKNLHIIARKIKKLPDNFYIPQSVTECDGMFYRCASLTQLPDNFTIPENVISCKEMFARCERLIQLPENFTLPKNLLYSNCMFSGCKNLKQLPENFVLPDSIIECQGMFQNCEQLNSLPQNFTIPDSCKYCQLMFKRCYALQELPINFKLSNKIVDCYSIFQNCVNLKKLSQNFTIPTSCESCATMFYECQSLQELPQNFTILKQIKACNLMFAYCTNLKTIPTKFLSALKKYYTDEGLKKSIFLDTPVQNI